MENKTLQECVEKVMVPKFGKNWKQLPDVKILWYEVEKLYASQLQPATPVQEQQVSAGQWVKASERLPNHYKPTELLHLYYKGCTGKLIPWTGTYDKKEKAFYLDALDPKGEDEFDNILWLDDESLSPTKEQEQKSFEEGQVSAEQLWIKHRFLHANNCYYMSSEQFFAAIKEFEEGVQREGVSAEELINKYSTYVSNLEFNLKQTEKGSIRYERGKQQLDCYSEALYDLKAMEQYAVQKEISSEVGDSVVWVEVKQTEWHDADGYAVGQLIEGECLLKQTTISEIIQQGKNKNYATI